MYMIPDSWTTFDRKHVSGVQHVPCHWAEIKGKPLRLPPSEVPQHSNGTWMGAPATDPRWRASSQLRNVSSRIGTLACDYQLYYIFISDHLVIIFSWPRQTRIDMDWFSPVIPVIVIDFLDCQTCQESLGPSSPKTVSFHNFGWVLDSKSDHIIPPFFIFIFLGKEMDGSKNLKSVANLPRSSPENPWCQGFDVLSSALYYLESADPIPSNDFASSYAAAWHISLTQFLTYHLELYSGIEYHRIIFWHSIFLSYILTFYLTFLLVF